MKVALAQIEVTSELAANVSKIRFALESARAANAELVVFPETAVTGYVGISRASLHDLNGYAVHAALQDLQAACATNRVAAAVGQYFKRCGRWYNNALLIDGTGRILTSYDKCHLVDRDCYDVEPGASPPQVVEFANAPMSLGICHDIRYPEHVRWAAIHGSRVHLHLFYGIRNQRKLGDQAIYDAHLSTRAAENGLFVLAANASHCEQMVRSQVRDPEGHTVARAESWREEMIYCDIDVSRGGDGWTAKRRSDLYSYAPTAPQRPTYFERAVWDKKPYMIEHDIRLLEDDS